MKVYHVAWPLVQRRGLTLSQCSLRKNKYVSAKHTADLSFPLHFEDKIRSWNRLIEIEEKARRQCNNWENLLNILPDLKLVAVKRNVSGLVAFLKCPHTVTDNMSRALSLLHIGKPLKLSPVINERANASTSSSSVVHRGVFVGREDDGCMMVKLFPSMESPPPVPNDSQDVFYRLDSDTDISCQESFQKLLFDRKRWTKYAGSKLFLYAYRARIMPVAFSDPKMTLPSEFNEEQCLAIRAALNFKRPITAILGPPGTGKTKVIGQIIKECIQERKKVLVCAPSHMALENIMEVCRRHGLEKYCKMHREDRQVRHYLKTRIESHAYFPMLEKLYEETNIAHNSDALDGTPEANRIQHNLRQRVIALERQIKMDIATGTQIFLCTLYTGSMMDIIKLGFQPDLAIIDEAGQATEVETWPMLFQAPRAVIVGDHKQLAPLIFSEKGKKHGLGVSLIETLDKEHRKAVMFPLKEQYRSNALIQEWSNKEFYNGMLKAHPDCANIHLRDLIRADPSLGQINVNSLAHFIVEDFIDDPLVLVDTDLRKDDSLLVQERYFEHSVYNYFEAHICAAHIIKLVKHAHIDPKFIGCITPYNAQVREINLRLPNALRNKIDISSVDAFQGQEREIIIMSFVRNNSNNSLGFLDDVRRMNVAITRAKRQFFLVASGQMMQINESISRLYTTFRDKGRIIIPDDVLPAKYFSKLQHKTRRSVQSPIVSPIINRLC